MLRKRDYLTDEGINYKVVKEPNKFTFQHGLKHTTKTRPLSASTTINHRSTSNNTKFNNKRNDINWLNNMFKPPGGLWKNNNNKPNQNNYGTKNFKRRPYSSNPKAYKENRGNFNVPINIIDNLNNKPKKHNNIFPLKFGNDKRTQNNFNLNKKI